MELARARPHPHIQTPTLSDTPHLFSCSISPDFAYRHIARATPHTCPLYQFLSCLDIPTRLEGNSSARIFVDSQQY